MTLLAEAPAQVVGGEQCTDFGGYPTVDALLDDFRPNMEEQARFMADVQARSHRGLFVGGCAFASLPDGGYTFLDGANYSPVPGIRKRCAEMWILWKAVQLGCTAIHEMTVVGPSDPEQIESVSGRPTDTLRSCAECLTKMMLQRRYRKLIIPDMVINTVTFDGERREHLTLREMWEEHHATERPLSSREALRQNRGPMPTQPVPPGAGGRPLYGSFAGICTRVRPLEF